MKKILFLTSLLYVLILCSCKKSGGPGDPGSQSGVLDMYSAGTNALTALLQYGTEHNTDPAATLAAILDSVKKMDNVAGAVMYDNMNMIITTKGGLQTILSIEFMNPDGSAQVRGAGEGHYKLEGVTGEAGKRIVVKNKRILFYSPAFDEFYSGALAGQDKVLEQIAVNSGKDISFERRTGYDLSPGIVKTFKDYGLVIMDTHGFSFGFMVGWLNVPNLYRKTLQPNGTYKMEYDKVRNDADVKKIITENNEAGVYESLLNGDFVTQFKVQVTLPYAGWVSRVNRYIGNRGSLPSHLVASTKYLESVPGFDSTIIFANMCYSGATNNGQPLQTRGLESVRAGYLAIRDAMLKKNPGAYYCWVRDDVSDGLRIENADAIAAEQSLLKSFLVDQDTTGNAFKTNAGGAISAHELGTGGLQSELRLFGKDNIWYGCGSGQITDERDGNVYKTICIGGKEWMAENLRYNAPGSLAYDNNPENAKQYGRLYSRQILMAGQAASNAIPSGVRGICPKGWHVPSAGELDQAIAAIGGIDVAGSKMKSKTGWTDGNGTNESGFNLLPGGTYNIERGYAALGIASYLRTSSTTLGDPGGEWIYIWSGAYTKAEKKNYTLSLEYGPWYYGCRCTID